MSIKKSLAHSLAVMAFLFIPSQQPALAVAKAQGAADKPPTTSSAPEGRMDTKLVLINEDAIRAGDYATFLQRHPDIVAKAATSENGKKEAIREMVIAYILRSSLYDEGLLKKSEVEPQPKEVSQAYDKLAEKHFPRPPVPDEKELYAYYEAHPEEFGIPAMTRLSQIEFRYKKGADATVVEATRERAKKALKRLEAGESFESLAESLTENPIGKVTKGDIGFVDFRLSPWMKPHVESLKIGERTGVVETPEGFEILRVTDIRPGLTSPYANVREKVSRSIRDAEQNKLRMAYIKEVAKKFKITVVRDDLKALFPNGIFEE